MSETQTQDKKKEQINTRILLKTGFWYTVSNFLTRAMAFLTTPLFTRIMPKDQYGDFAVFASWQAILLIICGLEIYGTLNRARFDFTDEKELNSYISSCLVLSTLLTGAVFIVYLIFPEMFHRFLLLDRRYVLVMFIYLFTYPAFAMFQAKQRIEYRYKVAAGLSFALVILSSLLAVVLVLTIKDDRLLGRVVGQYMLFAAAGLFFYVYFLRKSLRISGSMWKYALKIGLPLVFSFVGSTILLNSDNLIVKHLSTSEAVSYLYIAHTCAHIILIFVQSLNNAWAPWFYDKLNLGEKETIRKTFSVYCWFILGCTLAVLLIGPEIVLVLGGHDYREAIWLLPANLLCGIFTALTAQFVNLETFYKKTQYAAVLTAAAAAVNIVFDIIGVKLWGYRAACYVTVFCQLLLTGAHYFCTRKMGIRELLPLKNLVLLSAAALLLIPVSLLLYQNDAVRWIITGTGAAAVLAAAVIERKRLKALLVRIRKH